ncbi:Hypothetical protein I595_2478 [Croceitalea dokdonensis DOKDO 023]|uniref:Uncharacterized protein n=1 Tax=Croceitalea dokdonensis DOKDO 023 TaxID=1300341 RepID=A0A0P7A479_9FLAO|nr:Hypothetical protein I595_2478 [Croceitalea dokdonensis DOKDO 023]
MHPNLFGLGTVDGWHLLTHEVSEGRPDEIGLVPDEGS